MTNCGSVETRVTNLACIKRRRTTFPGRHGTSSYLQTRTADLEGWYTRFAPSLFATALMLVAAGCDSKPATVTPAGGSAATAPTAAASVNECEGTLASIDEIFNISRLERTTSISDGVLRLNDWQRTCAPSGAAAGPLPEEIEKLLAEPQIHGLTEKRFTQRDGEHLRDCLLERMISRFATNSPGTGAAKTELERAVNLFGHMVRAVGLVEAPPQDLPFTTYEVYLFGKGTVEDRAWLFVNVLRQLRIDALLLYPNAGGSAPAPSSAGPRFLVGVLLDNQVFLFDPQAGLAIPSLSGAATGAVATVATLAQAVADPAVLKQLDAGSERPYPITADGLRHPGVAIVGDAAFWSDRIQELQTQFVGDRALVIADPLQDAGNATGLWSRIVKAGGDYWTAADVRIWGHAEARMAARVELTQIKQDSLIGLMRPFGAYKVLAGFDGRTGQPVFVDKEEVEDRAADKKLHPGVHINKRVTAGEQMRARQLQLEGDFAQAIQVYTNVRSKSKDVLKAGPQTADRVMHAKAIDDAMFWTGMCQFEQGEFKSAVNTFQRYRKQPDSERWSRESRYLLALSLAAAGDTAAAITELESVPPDAPEYLGDRWLIRRWQAGLRRASGVP